MPTGVATLDFGAHPGSSHVSLAVTGQAAIIAGSLVEVWLRPIATADHTADEHMVETLKVIAADIVAGTGFTIHGFNVGQMNETPLGWRDGGNNAGGAGKGTRIYGLWTVAWAWI